VQADGVDGDDLPVIRERDTGGSESRAELGARQTLGDADEDRRADRAEGDRRALDHHADHHRRGGRESQSDHQWSRDGGWRAEAGGALYERAEQPGDDHQLDAPVVADPVEATANRRHTAGILERLEQKDRPEDDQQYVERDEEALDSRCGDIARVDPPYGPGERRGDDVDGGHGVLGGDTEPDEQHSRQQNRRNGD
jgi:hypothetical protein